MIEFFTPETVKMVMELCNWEKRNQFILASELKPKKLDTAIACIAPGLNREDVVAVRDDTVFQSGKVGWILTANKVYFHKDYSISSDPYGKKYFDFSQVKRVYYQEKSHSVRLIYSDDTVDFLDCGIDTYCKQIAEFLLGIIRLYNSGYYDVRSERKLVNPVVHSGYQFIMMELFERYPKYIAAKDLPEKKMALLRKRLKNPFQEHIIAFRGNFDPDLVYGHLFTTQYYYFFANGYMRDCVSLWELDVVYPHHGEEQMTAVMKDGTVRALNVGTNFQDEFEAIFEEILALRNKDNVRGQHMKESAEEKARRTRVIRKMNLLRNRDISRPYENHGNLKELGRKLETAGDTEELPFIYEHIGFYSSPPEDSYFYAKSYLYMPLSRISLSYVYYYLFCLKHNVRWCDHKIRRYEDLDYRAFINMCNQTPLTEVREKLCRELNIYRSLIE